MANSYAFRVRDTQRKKNAILLGCRLRLPGSSFLEAKWHVVDKKGLSETGWFFAVFGHEHFWKQRLFPLQQILIARCLTPFVRCDPSLRRESKWKVPKPIGIIPFWLVMCFQHFEPAWMPRVGQGSVVSLVLFNSMRPETNTSADSAWNRTCLSILSVVPATNVRSNVGVSNTDIPMVGVSLFKGTHQNSGCPFGFPLKTTKLRG